MISVEVEYINNNTVDNNDISKEIVTEEKSSDVSLNNATVSNDKNAAKMVINRRIKNIHVQCNICMNHITAIAVGSCNHHICMDCMLRLRCHYQYKSNVCCICKQECHRVLVYTVPNLDMDVLENKNENMKIHKRNKSLQYGHIVKRFNKYVNKLQEKERKDRNRDRKPTKEKSGANSAAYDANVADINQYIHQSICIPYKDVIFHEFTSSSVRFSQEDGLLPFHYQCEAQESGSGPMKKNSESCVSETALTNESSVDAVVNGNIESTSVSLKGKVVKHTLSAYAAEFNPYVRINKSDAASSTKSDAAGITMTEVTLDNIGASIAVAKPIPAVLEWYIDYACDIAYCNLNHASFMELINANGNTISNAKGKLVTPVHSSSIMSTEQFKLFVRDVSAKLELKCPLCSYESSKRHKNSCREKQPLLGNGDDGIVVYRDLKQLLKHIQKHNPMPTQPSTAASPSLCLCTVCVEHSNMMLGEIPIYCNRKELEKHQQGLICHSVNNIANSVNIDTDKKQKTGDGANSKKQTNRICNPAMVGGHPKCVFCNTLFYDAAKLYTHMRQEHYSCPCANCGSQNLTSRLPNPSSGDSREIYTFYVDAEALYEHYACEHYTCGDANCKGLVFVTHQEYNLHRRQVHHEFVDINALPTIMSHGNSSNVRGSTRGNRKAMVASCVLDMTRPNPNVKLMGNARNSRIRDGDYSPTRSADSASMNSNLSPNTITQTTQVPAHMRITGHVQGSGIFIPQKTDVEEAGAGVRSGSDYKSKKTPKPYDTHSSNTNIEFSTDLFPTLTPNSANKTNADSASHGSVHHPLSLIGLQQQRNAEKALQKRLLAEEAKAVQSLLEERNEVRLKRMLVCVQFLLWHS